MVRQRLLLLGDSSTPRLRRAYLSETPWHFFSASEGLEHSVSCEAPPIMHYSNRLISMELTLGAVAGALAQVFTIPMSVIATRQQLQDHDENRSFFQTFFDILKEDGITGLWRGLKPSLVLTINPAITYGESLSDLRGFS